MEDPVLNFLKEESMVRNSPGFERIPGLDKIKKGYVKQMGEFTDKQIDDITGGSKVKGTPADITGNPDFDNGRGDDTAARGMDSQADIIMGDYQKK